jgi:virulence-associated protein VagC
MDRQRFVMGKTETAELFTDGDSQAVRLPRHFRLPGQEVRVRHFGRGVLLEPLERKPKRLVRFLLKSTSWEGPNSCRMVGRSNPLCLSPMTSLSADDLP